MKANNLTAVMYWLNHRHSIYRNKLEVNGSLDIQNHQLSKDQEENITRALKLANLLISTNGETNDIRRSKNNQKNN